MRSVLYLLTILMATSCAGRDKPPSLEQRDVKSCCPRSPFASDIERLPPVSDPTRRRALIVAISKFSRGRDDGADGIPNDWPDLPGASCDAEAMRRVLVEKFGFANDQIIV